MTIKLLDKTQSKIDKTIKYIFLAEKPQTNQYLEKICQLK